MAENALTENWRRVEGFPLYEVSDLGNVRSYRQLGPGRHVLKTPRQMKPQRSWNGYYRVILTGDDAKRLFTVHRLVATAFHGPAPDGAEVRHLDGDRANNRADNLAWGTHSQNMNDAYRHGTHPGFSRRKDPMAKPEKESGFWGSDAKSARREERREAGRVPCSRSPLTADDVRYIRAARGRVMGKDLAKQFGIGKQSVSAIQLRQRWTHI